jgi:hypothetical protein
VDAARVVATIARGRAEQRAQSTKDGGAWLLDRLPRTIAAATQQAASGVGRSMRGTGIGLRRLAGRVERSSED